jgi:peptidoglycan hydrolase FlgJ
MAINPGSDLLSDALLAADPQRAQAAAERLAKLSANPEAATEFDAAFGAQPALTQETSLPVPGPATVQVPGVATESHSTSQGKRGNPYEQFEAAMLKSFFEMMLPGNADSVYGTGFAGEVWKSMFAQALAASVANKKITRIADDLEQRARRAKS